MSYWQQVENVAGMGGWYRWTLIVLIILVFPLAAVTPAARLRLRASVLLIGVSFLGILFCALFAQQRPLSQGAAGFRYVHFGSQLLLAIAVINVAGVLLFRVLLRPVNLSPPPILRDTILGGAYIVVGLILLGRHGVDLSGLIATSAVVTAIIGFSLQDTLGNVMGGVALQMERSIAVGDWIRIGEIEGLVREIRWRQTSIETRNWDTVVIPNSVLMKSQVIVLGRREGRPKLHRMWVRFNVDFRYPPVDVIDAVGRALQSETIANVALDPQPDCILEEFKESYGQYAVRYWLTDFAKDLPTNSEVATRIFVALQRAGMNPSIPAQSVFLTMESRTRAHAKEQQEIEHRAGMLKGVKLLQPLNDAERQELAGKLNVAPFRSGEVITRQGNQAHFLYIMGKGDADISVAAEGVSRVVAKIGPGETFGEMGLMTGEPRTATVQAVSDVVCYRLDKSAFQDVLHRRPELAESISHLLAQRKAELAALREGLHAESLRHTESATQPELLQRIKKFFTLS
jgi:small-conductance mechanosensitive channel/CRP-like cAMP-binding protein